MKSKFKPIVHHTKQYHHREASQGLQTNYPTSSHCFCDLGSVSDIPSGELSMTLRLLAA